MSEPRERVPVCGADDLLPGERRIATVAGVEVGVFNLGDRLVAYRNQCPHQGAPVCQGRVGGIDLAARKGVKAAEEAHLVGAADEEQLLRAAVSRQQDAGG